jgi:tetratricopeptide (TPR) repeat protein
MKKAEGRLRDADALPAVTEYQEFNQKALPIFLLGRGRWEDALASLRRFQEGKWASSRVVGHTLAGHALLALGRNAEARQALAAAEKEMATVPTLVGGLAVSRGAVLPYVDTLRGEVMLREGRADEGRALLKDVQKRLRALFGPDAWIQSLFRLESIARTARDVGDWELAEYTAAQMVDHDAAYGGSHLAMALVARHKGDAAGATRSMEAAARYWRDADTDLPELAEVRQARLTAR